MPLTTSRVCIYIALIVLIIALMYIKGKNDLLEEGLQENFDSTFVDTAVNIKITSGPNVGLVVNNNDLLAGIPSSEKR